jgi:hypothetical protein
VGSSFFSIAKVVILGANFATGLRHGGTPSGYLVGVVDKFDENCFMTLNTVNAGSITKVKMEEILRYTGFKRGGDEALELGKWFREDDFGLPSFVSKRSLQRNCTEDFEGWTFNKTKHYPDIWIDPKDSVVLTIKCAELVVSVSFCVAAFVFRIKVNTVMAQKCWQFLSSHRMNILLDSRCDFLALKKSVSNL